MKASITITVDDDHKVSFAMTGNHEDCVYALSIAIRNDELFKERLANAIALAAIIEDTVFPISQKVYIKPDKGNDKEKYH